MSRRREGPYRRRDGPSPGGLLDRPPDPRLVAGLAVVLVALHLALAWLGRSPGLLTGQDDAAYVLLGRALREHLAYRELFQAGTPLHGKFPPFFPAVLAVWTGVLGESWTALAALGVLVSAGTLVLVFDAVRRTAGPVLALGSLAVLAVNPFLVLRAGTAWSEPLYGFLGVFAAWVLLQGDDGRHAWIAGALAVAAVWTRMAGVTVLAALVAHWALERDWRRASAMAGAGLLAAGGWLAWSVSVWRRGDGGDSYVGLLSLAASDLSEQIRGDAVPAPGGGGGLTDALAEAADAVVSAGGHLVSSAEYLILGLDWRFPLPHLQGTPVDNVATAVVIAGGLAAGGALWLWRSWRAAALYLAASLAFLFLFPIHAGRFLEPLLPLVVPTVIVGVAGLALRWAGRGAALAAAAVLVVGAVAEAVPRMLPRVQQRARCSAVRVDGGARDCMTPDQRSYFEALAYIDRHLPRDAVLLSAKPEPTYYYTGRRSVDDGTAVNVPPDRFYRFLDRTGVDYVLLGSLRMVEPYQLLPRLETRCERLEPVASFPPRTRLFRLLPPSVDPPDSGEPPGCRALRAYREASEDRDFTGRRLY